MNKLDFKTIALAALVIIWPLAGCSVSTGEPSVLDRMNTVRVLIDPATGCQYVLSPEGGGIYPRLEKDGSHVCHED
jgi:hypothetical protein